MGSSETLVRVWRGATEESSHRGSLAVVERERVVLARGDLDRVVFYRSASKPLQALELVRGGAADAFGLSAEEIAVATGSHNAEPNHLDAVRSLLAKSGVPESALRCGGHRSIDPEVAFAQRRDGVPLSPLLSNCSGKHAGLLAVAKHRGDPLEGYMSLDHPVQGVVLRHVAAFCGIEPDRVLAGVDGCGVPAFAVPLVAMARSMARLGSPERLPDDLSAAARRIGDAMSAHPEMVAGTDRFDTELMRRGRERLLAKSGAEGVHLVALPARGLGMAVKVDDGNDRGYRAVVVETLRRLGAVTDEDANALREKFAPEVVKNHAGTVVGRASVAF